MLLRPCSSPRGPAQRAEWVGHGHRRADRGRSRSSRRGSLDRATMNGAIDRGVSLSQQHARPGRRVRPAPAGSGSERNLTSVVIDRVFVSFSNTAPHRRHPSWSCGSGQHRSGFDHRRLARHNYRYAGRSVDVPGREPPGIGAARCRNRLAEMGADTVHRAANPDRTVRPIRAIGDRAAESPGGPRTHDQNSRNPRSSAASPDPPNPCVPPESTATDPAACRRGGALGVAYRAARVQAGPHSPAIS